MGPFFNFERLIAPTIIKIVYWIGLVVIVLGGLFAMFQAVREQGGIGGVLAVLGIAAAILFWRILCELYIVVFGVYERLGDIRDRLGGSTTRGQL